MGLRGWISFQSTRGGGFHSSRCVAAKKNSKKEAFAKRPATVRTSVFRIYTMRLKRSNTTNTTTTIFIIAIIEWLFFFQMGSSKPLSSAMKAKVDTAKSLYRQYFTTTSRNNGNNEKDWIAVSAPGRVNLIGEHTDYTGGFVLPFAIDYSTVVLGTGSLRSGGDDNDDKARAVLEFASSSSSSSDLIRIELTEDSLPPTKTSWTTYVAGTVFQYLPDLPKSSVLTLRFVICGDVPLGSGLSSSASLEVSVARFVEEVLGSSVAFSSIPNKETDAPILPAKIRAIRCQKAENTWCGSPCGIMDQYVSSAAQSGAFLLIDCTSLDYQETKMNLQSKTDSKVDEDEVVLVVTNSNVQHDIAGGEYPIRVQQCKEATRVLNDQTPTITTLREATLHDVETAFDKTSVCYRRAKHVVTENARTLECKLALEAGDWKTVGRLMNESHASMKDDYEVSCDEIDCLVRIAQTTEGVYGSRLTGGGFGGCTVTLVKKSAASNLVQRLQRDYRTEHHKECVCFETQPSQGAHMVSLD